MVDERELSAVLADFARTMLADFRLQAILDGLVGRIVDILPVTGAGVTLMGPDQRPHHVAASDELALLWEKLQTELGEGPCTVSFTSGEAVSVPDLAAVPDYPQFRPPAVAAGLAAVFTFPLRGEGGLLGVLDLYRDAPGPLADADLAAAQTLADVASAYLRNAAARQAAEDTSNEHRDRSLHDSLTGLPNGRLLRQRIEHAAARARRTHSSCAVLFADLDRFERVNDEWGHDVGDQLLVAVAHRLNALVRPGDTLARLYADEFVVFCEDLDEPASAEVLAERVAEAFRTPFRLVGAEVRLSASVGIAYAGPGDVITPQLLVEADAAMDAAKRGGGGTHKLVDLRVEHDAPDRDGLALDLHRALTGAAPSELAMAFQPVVRLTDGRVVGAEALLRWTHPDRGPVPALVAVEVAEANGLGSLLGAWVLRRSCEEWTRWLPSPDGPLTLSVNVSVQHMMQPDFAATLSSVLSETGMEPAALVLEVTEGVFIDDGERASQVFEQVRALGVRLALDDFGTRYSSLGYLRRFPVDVIKIDRSFVTPLGQEPTADAIAAAIVELSHVLSMSVTAEGVETDLQRGRLEVTGCENAQGFLFARPMPPTELRGRLERSADHVLLLP